MLRAFVIVSTCAWLGGSALAAQPVRASFPTGERALLEGGSAATAAQASGTRSHTLLGAAVGFGVGAAATFALLTTGGSTALCDQDRNQDAMSDGECLAMYGLGGLAGAGIGALIGHFVRTDRRSVAPMEGVRLGIVPSAHGGMRVAVSLPGL